MAWKKSSASFTYIESHQSLKSFENKNAASKEFIERDTDYVQTSKCEGLIKELEEELTKIDVQDVKKKAKKRMQPGLDLDYTILLSKRSADLLFEIMEQEVQYFSGDLTRVRVFGKWCDIPRKQVSYGDEGLSYKFSGTTVPALPWPDYLILIRRLVERVTGHDYNFVLVNRYKDGNDKIGEHKDDEKDLASDAPIASLSLGQPRDFTLRHEDCKNNKQSAFNKLTEKLLLEHGSLLLMNPPTNRYWYHSLPARKNVIHPRINLTFRKMNKR